MGWGMLLHCTELLLHRPAQIMDDGLGRPWNAFGLVTHPLSVREGAVSLGIFALFSLLCFWQRERLLRLLKFMLELSGAVFLLAGVLEYCLAYSLLCMRDQDKEIALRMNCMFPVFLALVIILFSQLFLSRNVKLDAHLSEQRRNRAQGRIV